MTKKGRQFLRKNRVTPSVGPQGGTNLSEATVRLHLWHVFYGSQCIRM